MQIPFFMLSYDEFNKSKKLFSYERDGIHTMPVFTDISRAMQFAESMTQILQQQFKDKRALKIQSCDNPKRALDMFETIAVYCPDLMRVIIDSYPPVRNSDGLTDLKHLRWIEDFQDIDDVIQQLQDWVSVDKEIDSAANGDPESNQEKTNTSSSPHLSVYGRRTMIAIS